MIHLSQSSTETIWNIVKESKTSQLNFATGDCDEHGLDKKIVSHVKAVENLLNMNESTEIFRDITDKSLKVAGEMFLYLNSCPYESYPFEFELWFKFYDNLFKNKSPEVIVLTISRMLKGKGNHSNKRLKTTANQLFTRLTSLLSLKYRNIQNITQGLSYSSWNGGAKFDYHFLFVNYTLI